MKNFDIIGVGGPILDQLLQVPENYLKQIAGKKGGMEAVDYLTLERIVAESGVALPVLVPGGSARNTLDGLARFGERCALLGMIGRDERGTRYRELLKEQRIESLLLESPTPTATVLALVTPDGERTMRTFQGASIEIRGFHLKPEFFEGIKLVHLEGYTLFNDDLTETAMALAQSAGAKVSFDLASFEIVEKYRDHILHLLDKYVDIIFANEQEAFSLTGEKKQSISCDFLAERCEIGVVLMGPKGCWVKKGKHKLHCPAYPVEPLDTTGAGDLFASGFLHGIMRHYPIDICAHYGAIAGRAVVQGIGPIISEEGWREIFKQLQREL